MMMIAVTVHGHGRTRNQSSEVPAAGAVRPLPFGTAALVWPGPGLAASVTMVQLASLSETAAGKMASGRPAGALRLGSG